MQINVKKNCGLYTVVMVTDQKPQKSKKAILTTLSRCQS